MLNLDDRARAIELVTAAIRTRTEFVLTVIREQPTAILSGELVPGTLFGIEHTAAGIVDGTLDLLGLPIPGQRRRNDMKAAG